MKINENIAYARSILNKSGISQDSEEYKDYLKIREICGNNNGYVGILTKIRFVDNVEDMDEIASIFDVLKNSKIDINKLNRMSYDEILEIFYEELGGKIDKTDIELIFKDDQYSYYRVYTYKGILKIGSPSWCLKTKSNWDNYQLRWPEQWVVIDNRYKNQILSVDNNYLDNYSNPRKPWIRYGISLRHNDGGVNWVGNDDNNGEVLYKPDSWTFYGILCTVFNLTNGIKKSYYERFPGSEKYTDRWLKITDKKWFCKRMMLSENTFHDEDEIFVFFSRSYSQIPIIISFNDVSMDVLFPTNRDIKDNDHFINQTLQPSVNIKLLLKYCSEERDILYCGIKLKNGLITIVDIEKLDGFIKKVDNWLVFDRNKNYYLIINTLEGTDRIQMPTRTLKKGPYEMDNPPYWYLDKRTLKPYKGKINDYQQKIIDNIINDDSIIKEKPEVKKVGKFWDFFKRNKK